MPRHDEWIKRFYYVVLYAWYGLYAIALLGIATVAPAYLDTLNLVLKYFIIGFLLVRFNPWTKYNEFTAFDRTIVFSAAFFLLASTAVASLITTAFRLPNMH
uniref:Uncharacterized protein n=1 Tax=viral metagenome TaxID=1070528 RepID=A0A6C0M0R7_9ZZZZ